MSNANDSKVKSKLTPVSGFALEFWVHPAVVKGALRISLRQAKRLHGAVLAVALAALDADVLGLEILIIIKDQPAIFVPQGDALVHSVVPGLQALHSTLRRSSKHGGKVLLDALPLELLVMPGVNDEITFLGGVLLVDVPVLAVRRRAGVAVVGVHKGIAVAIGRVGV